MMPLEEVVHIKSFDSNENSLRKIVALLPSPEKNNLNVRQIRVALTKEAGTLGNHWREYKELYGVIGDAEFTLKDIVSKEQKSYHMETGDTLEVPPCTALRVSINYPTVIICLSESYDREKGTHKYMDFD